jgi:hypothetical protein
MQRLLDQLLPVLRRWGHFALLALLFALVACGLTACGVWFVTTEAIPRWGHGVAEFIGWWLIGGLIMGFAWAVVMRYDRARRAPYVGQPWKY